MTDQGNYRNTYKDIRELYSALSLESDEFRLLLIETVSETGVVCYLNKHKLPYDDVQYAAISYTWGSQPFDHHVQCNGIDLSVTKSCFDALSALGNGGSVLNWIDQLCIDQQNLVERGEQVMLMSKIYSGAEMVFIWLDKFENLTYGIDEDHADHQWQMKASDAVIHAPSSNSMGAIGHRHTIEQQLEYTIALMGRLFNYYRFHWAKFRSGVDEMKLDKFPTSLPAWDRVLAILRHPYFERRWIIQEVFSRETGVCVYLDKTHPLPLKIVDGCAWALIHLTKGSMPEIGPIIPSTVQEKLKEMVQQLFYCTTAFSIRDAAGSLMTNPSLIYLLTKCRRCKTTDQRDRIFAFQSLANDDKLPKPDYHRSLDDQLLELALHYINQGQGNEMIPLAGLALRLDATTVPSWCPTWEDLSPVCGMPHMSKSCSAAGSTTPKMTLCSSPDKNQVRVRGALIDTVQQLTPPVIGAQFLEHTGGINIEALKMLRTFAPEKHLSAEEFDALVAPHIGAVANVERIRAIGTIPEQFELILGLWQYPQELAQKGEEHYSKLLRAMHATSYNIIFDSRVFCVTSQGYVGVIHELARVGDLVTIIEGVGVPMILRESGEKDGTFQVVADSYFSGLSKGEAMEMDFYLGRREFVLT